MSLYNTFTDYVGDGTTTDYALPFPYLDPADVVVTVGGVTATFSFISSNVVRLSTAPASSAAIHVARSTLISSAKVVYGNGSSTTAQQLNKSITQLLYAMQEAVDRASLGNSDAATALATAIAASTTANSANTTANTASTTANLSKAEADTAITSAGNAASAAAAAQAAAVAAAAAASVHTAADLPYVNTTSHLSASNVQQAIDLIAGASGITTLAASTINNDSTVTGSKVSNALNTLNSAISALSGSVGTIAGQITTLQADDASLATVAHSGAYNDLTGKPTIGSSAAKNLATAANIRANSGTDVIPVDQAWAAAGYVNLGNVTGSITIDCSTGIRFYGVLTGNVTVSFSNLKDGQPVDLVLSQDATGSRTVSWASNVRFPDNTAPTINTTASTVAVVLSGVWSAALSILFAAGWKIN